MPRYDFDVLEAGGLTLDDEGTERDVEAVQDAGCASADTAREAVNSGSSVGHDMAIEVRDADGPSFRSN
jgi:hypothetical protein